MNVGVYVQPEVWLPVVGHEGVYEVSSLGRVRSLDRLIWRENQNGGHHVQVRGRVLRAATVESGHKSVALTRRGGSRLVHQLVAEAFIGPRPPGHEVLHADANPANNRPKNLSWGTRSDNLRDDYATGNRGNQRPVIVRGASGCEDKFVTLRSAAHTLGVCTETIRRNSVLCRLDGKFTYICEDLR